MYYYKSLQDAVCSLGRNDWEYLYHERILKNNDLLEAVKNHPQGPEWIRYQVDPAGNVWEETGKNNKQLVVKRLGGCRF